MLVTQIVKGTTPSGRTWITQITCETNDLKGFENNLKQLEYERSQLL